MCTVLCWAGNLGKVVTAMPLRRGIHLTPAHVNELQRVCTSSKYGSCAFARFFLWFFVNLGILAPFICMLHHGGCMCIMYVRILSKDSKKKWPELILLRLLVPTVFPSHAQYAHRKSQIAAADTADTKLSVKDLYNTRAWEIENGSKREVAHKRGEVTNRLNFCPARWLGGWAVVCSGVYLSNAVSLRYYGGRGGHSSFGGGKKSLKGGRGVLIRLYICI